MEAPLEMDPTHGWFDLDNAFESPLGDLDNDLTLVDSISPSDCDLMYPDMNGLNADCSEPWFSEFVSYEAPGTLDSLAPFPDADYMFNDTETLPASGAVDPFICGGRDGSWQHMLLQDQPYDLASSLRQVVEAQAAADTRGSSTKEKRIEASIAIHMQRLHEESMANPDMDPTTSLSSPCSSDLQGGVSPVSSRASNTATPASNSSPNSSGTDPTAGVELVLDLNMNTTTSLPKKQKPRSQAQKDNYIKIRKHGACEKHRKQHKRCNCLEKTTSRVSAAGLDPTRTTTVHLPRQTPLHVHSPQSKRSLLPSKDSSNSESPKLRKPGLPGHNTDKQSYNPVPSYASGQPSLPSQYPGHSLASGGHFVPGNDRPVKLQVRPPTQLASSGRAGNPSQDSLHGKKSLPSGPKSRPSGQQTPRSNQSTWRVSYLPSKTSPAGESDCNFHPRHGHKQQPARSSQSMHPSTAAHGSAQSRGNDLWNAANFSLTKNAGQFFGKTLATYFSVWQAPSAITSWAGSFFGKAFIACFRQFWPVKGV